MSHSSTLASVRETTVADRLLGAQKRAELGLERRAAAIEVLRHAKLRRAGDGQARRANRPTSSPYDAPRPRASPMWCGGCPRSRTQEPGGSGSRALSQTACGPKFATKAACRARSSGDSRDGNGCGRCRAAITVDAACVPLPGAAAAPLAGAPRSPASSRLACRWPSIST